MCVFMEGAVQLHKKSKVTAVSGIQPGPDHAVFKAHSL